MSTRARARIRSGTWADGATLLRALIRNKETAMTTHDGTIVAYERGCARGIVSVEGRDIAFVATCFDCGPGWRHPRVGERVRVGLVPDHDHPLFIRGGGGR